ncbi:MAG: hypothetical protein B6242_03840 [Anaerolineaceae bacterium 4572_78]|nr:MAG: hypothetical protein B6242_03840 [Anaerolineaceae bacterium 4572_78]
MKYFIIEKDKSYTFSDYFHLDPPIDDLLDYFGYIYDRQDYALPKTDVGLQTFGYLKEHTQGNLYQVDLSSEIARREALISPVLFAVARYLKAIVKIEYPMKVNEQLKGKIDYFIRRENNLLVVEAKQGDLQRGFTQLAVELIAFDKWLDDDDKPIYGIVSMGNVWQFGILNRHTKIITQDMNLFRVPADLDELLQILLAILG